MGVSGSTVKRGGVVRGEFRHALDVVGVVMGEPDLRQGPAACGKFSRDGGCFGNVDQGHVAGCLIAQQEGVIV